MSKSKDIVPLVPLFVLTKFLVQARRNQHLVRLELWKRVLHSQTLHQAVSRNRNARLFGTRLEFSR